MHTLLTSTSRPSGTSGDGAASRTAPIAHATTSWPACTTKIPYIGFFTRSVNHRCALLRHRPSVIAVPVTRNISARSATRAPTSNTVARLTTTASFTLTNLPSASRGLEEQNSPLRSNCASHPNMPSSRAHCRRRASDGASSGPANRLNRSRRGVRPISSRNRTDLDADYDRSRRGLRPISAEKKSGRAQKHGGRRAHTPDTCARRPTALVDLPSLGGTPQLSHRSGTAETGSFL